MRASLLTAFLTLASLTLPGISQAAPVQVRHLDATDRSSGLLCDRCLPGDYLISNGIIELVIGNSHRRDESFYKFPTADALGSIIYYRAAGSTIAGDIMLGTPYLRIDNTTKHIRYDSLNIVPTEQGITVVATGVYDEAPAGRILFEMQIPISADSNYLELSLTASNDGEKPLSDVIYALYFDPHQVYDFSPADVSQYRDTMTFRAYPRANHLFAWLDTTARHSADSDYDWGWDGGMILPDPLAVTLAPGASETRKFTLFTGADNRQVLDDLYQQINVNTETAYLDLESKTSDYFEVIVREANTSAIFFRSFLDATDPLALQLPPGNYVAEASYFPASVKCTLIVTTNGPSRCTLRDPPTGTVTVRVVDSSGNDVPGKVTFNGVNATPTPYFRTVNPAKAEGYWESRKNSVFPLNTAKQVTLPEGIYLASASLGTEFSLDQRTVTVSSGQDTSLLLTIDRVIDRPDLVSVDPHLHTLQSDGSVTVEEKVEALVASGVNVAISTDHNFPVDYQPELERLGLQDYLTVFVGTEVTVPERLDYNTYPMKVEPQRRNNGAIDSLSTNLAALFKASRARDPGIILQINHPRLWQFDYFNWHGLDTESAAFAYEGFELDFDVLEVVNSALYDIPSNQATRNDWFNLLRRGYFFPLVGSSDSHEIDQDEPGYSRTYVYRDPGNTDPIAADWLMQGIRSGHSFASNGPILDFTVQGQLPGATVSASNGNVSLQFDVWTAPWVDARQVNVYINGEPRSVVMKVVEDSKATHLRGSLTLALKHDAFLIAEVTGKDNDLYPVLQTRGGSGQDGEKVFPFALTNPVFVDVDGNGKYDPPLEHKIELRPRKNVPRHIAPDQSSSAQTLEEPSACGESGNNNPTWTPFPIESHEQCGQTSRKTPDVKTFLEAGQEAPGESHSR